MKTALEEYEDRLQYSGIDARSYYEACEMLMDSDITEKLHNNMAPCTDIEFLEKYDEEHRKKYDEDFVVN